MSNFTFTGIAQMERNLSRVINKLQRDEEKSLKREAKSILAESQILVPEREGELANSGQISEIDRSNNEVSIKIGYGEGGDDTLAKRAIALHEHPSEFSPDSWKGKASLDFTKPGSGEKYLERPLNNAISDMARRLADDMKLD